MVLRIILYAVGFIGLVGFSSEKELIPAVICAGILAGPAVVRLYRAFSAAPSQMVCPNCGSSDVFISSQVEGMTFGANTEFKRSFVFPNHRAKVQSLSGSKINRQRMARCQKCGFDYRFISAEEVQQERSRAIKSGVIVGIAAVLAVIMGVLS